MVYLNFNKKSIIAISDTHGRHRELTVPPCDFLIHCGDICTDGDEYQINDFFEWFSTTPATYKLFVSGNHDYPFVFEPTAALSLLPPNIIFLEDRMKTIAGISFYGLTSRENLFEIPEVINGKVDFLLTHIPPKSILDNHLGCSYLSEFVKMQQPQFHIFGHVHKSGGKKIIKGATTYINACSFLKEN